MAVFQRYYHTIKYLRLGQIISRLWFLLRWFFYRRFSGLINSHYDQRSRHASMQSIRLLKGMDECRRFFPSEELSEGYENRAKAVLSNVFKFLNTELQFDPQIGWHVSGASKLWRYHLHYFDYALDLALHFRVTSTDAAYEKFRDLTLDWITHNQIGRSEGWEAYPASLRMVNWILAFHLFSGKTDLEPTFSSRFLKILFKHALFLEHNLEHHICGNHLIKNGKALVFAGLFFRGNAADRWYKKGTALLWRELGEQILADGGHFERSPMYHSIVLQDYLEIYLLLRKNDRDVPLEVENQIRSMLTFLVDMLQPDGDIPLLNDAALQFAPSPQTLLSVGASLFGKIRVDKNPSIQPLDSSGYYVMRDKSLEKYLIVDCGKMCPDYLPAHAHADTLSYELSIGNERIIVDSGVYEYAPGKWRDFYRSARAHNTVVVDGLEHSDVWGAFRVGRRASPIKAKWIATDDVIFFEGGHDGYLKSIGVLHKRRIFFIEHAFWLILDELVGGETHLVEEYIHFHPEMEIVHAETIAVCKSKQQRLQVIPFGQPEIQIIQGELDPIQGWYSPEFGKQEPNATLLLRYEIALPAHIGYALFPTPVENFAIDSLCDDGRLTFTLNDVNYRIELMDDSIGFQKENGA